MELDGRTSTSIILPASQISKCFNDYINFQFANPSYYLENGVKTPIAGKDHLFSLCKEYNPTDTSRPHRDSSEIMNHFRTLRGTYTKCYVRYTASGFHETDNDPDGTFLSYINGDNKLLYAFSLWKNLNISMLGRVLSDEGKADTSVGDQPATPLTPHEVKKQKSEKKSKSPKGEVNNFSSVTMKPYTDAIQIRNQTLGLQAVGLIGNEKHKIWAIKKISEINSLNMPTDLLEDLDLELPITQETDNSSLSDSTSSQSLV